MRAFLIFHEYIQKIILFEISPIKTQNNTENCIKLGTNITNEASKEWTLRLNPQKASMFSNERKFRFLDLSNPKPNRNEKSLKTPSLYTKIHHLFIVPKNFQFLPTLLPMLKWNKFKWPPISSSEIFWDLILPDLNLTEHFTVIWPSPIHP